jgi:hypothetical protein
LVTAVSSTAEMVDTTLEASISRMNWLDSAGNTVFTAGKSMTCTKVCRRDRPRALAASTWP